MDDIDFVIALLMKMNNRKKLNRIFPTAHPSFIRTSSREGWHCLPTSICSL